MDKKMYQNKRSNRINGYKEDRIGIPLGIHDKNDIELKSGDIIQYKNEKCIILFNHSTKRYEAMLMRTNWYADHNLYNEDSYGCSYTIPFDDGAKTDIEKVNN